MSNVTHESAQKATRNYYQVFQLPKKEKKASIQDKTRISDINQRLIDPHRQQYERTYQGVNDVSAKQERL